EHERGAALHELRVLVGDAAVPEVDERLARRADLPLGPVRELEHGPGRLAAEDHERRHHPLPLQDEILRETTECTPLTSGRGAFRSPCKPARSGTASAGRAGPSP